MTTEAKTGRPETDAKPDAIETKTPKVEEVRSPLNVTSLWMGIVVSAVALGSAIVGVIINHDRTEQRSLDTAAKVEKLQDVASDVRTLKVEFSYMKSSVESFDKKLDRILEAKK